MIKLTTEQKNKIWNAKFNDKEYGRCRCFMSMQKSKLRKDNLLKEDEKNGWDIGFKLGKSKSNINGHSNLRPLCIRCLKRIEKD